MANQQHLELLKRGVAEWNAWRAANPAIRPDLAQADLAQTDLTRADLSGADLTGAQLYRAHLVGAYLVGAYLREADLRRADLTGAQLTGAGLQRADLTGAQLTGAGLQRADLTGADLMWAQLQRADLREADFTGADLREADFTGADLRKAGLQQAQLTGTDLREADLREADLREADLRGAQLTGTRLTEAILRFTTFGDIDLSGVQGLDTIQHLGPSTIGIDALYRSGGNLPPAFLRGCGVPDTFIEYLPSLIGAQDVIQYYSCFISYSTKDEDLARRLHGRMQQEHLRVWYAPEEIKGGDYFYTQIDEAIRVYDKLLLVLSEHSIASNWVMFELRKARRAELSGQKRKLFPIRLVGMEALTAWECIDPDTGDDLALEVRRYHIPDFSTWKEHDAFEAAFARLLRDLRAAERTPPARGHQ